ncbi:MAG: hypothetical protein IKR60_01355 [Alphaproteobacteria bacterium]|nr:hypothetical protein [Alphaproteobacteria bacterium]
MKPLLVLARITLIGCLWSIIFIEGVRVIVLENWRFDIFWPPHWVYAYNLWTAGWVIDTPKEWAFILILLAFIPLWLTGWIALSLIPWERIIYKIVSFPFRLIKRTMSPLKYVAMPTPVIQKKKSYKEVRPTSKRVPIYDYSTTQPPAPIQTTPQAAAAPALAAPAASSNPTKNRAAAARETLNHTIFDLDEGDGDFDLDIDSFGKSDIFTIDSNKRAKSSSARREEYMEDEETYQTPQKTASKKKRFDFDDDDMEEYRPKKSASRDSDNRSRQADQETDRRSRREKPARRDAERDRAEKTKNSRSSEFEAKPNATVTMLEDAGYDVFQNIQIDRVDISYAAVSAEDIVLLCFDAQAGDWLADEERFNDEDPLWFSENSHRISPVYKASLARDALESAIDDSDLDCRVRVYVVETNANIINAEDMLDVWADMDVNVVRSGRGGPTELPTLVKSLPTADERLKREELSDLKRIFKKLDTRKS